MSLAHIRVVLVATTHPGNIGAAARAMKTMGLQRLALVAPRHFPHPEATAMAAGAEDLLEQAGCFTTLDEALVGCTLVLGASARMRSISWPVVSPRYGGELAVAAAGRGEQVALVLGRERSGLTNEELDRCHQLVHIPSNPDYSSLNVAAALQVLAYEVRVAQLAGIPPLPELEEPLASAEDLEGYFRHLEEVLTAIEFLDPEAPGYVMRRLRRLFNRSHLQRHELHILRGIFTQIQRQMGQ